MSSWWRSLQVMYDAPFARSTSTIPVTCCWKSTARSRSATLSAMRPMRVTMSFLVLRPVFVEERLDRARRAAGETEHVIGGDGVGARGEVGGHASRVLHVPARCAAPCEC